MQITFDPRDPDECDETLRIIAQSHPDVVKTWLIDCNENQDSEAAQPDVEFAECITRILNTGASTNTALIEKNRYNATRAAGGKKY